MRQVALAFGFIYLGLYIKSRIKLYLKLLFAKNEVQFRIFSNFLSMMLDIFLTYYNVKCISYCFKFDAYNHT